MCTRMRSRSRAPSAAMKSGPNACAMAGMAAPPAAVVAREMASASIVAAPSSRSIPSTVLLPLPMPPVRPTRTVAAPSEADDLQDGGRPEQQGREPGAREERPERHVAAFAQLAREFHGDADDGADDRGHEHDGHQRLPAEPGAQRREQLEVAIAHAHA